MENKFLVSFAPHLRGNDSIRATMLDVIIALLPALIGGVYFFGFRALTVTAVAVVSCVLAEFLWDKAIKKPNTTGDLSAVVTGMLLAFSLPPAIPYYMVVVGSVFAIIVVKMFFGGVGQNIVNPALAARAFLMASWPVAMTRYTAPHTHLNLFSGNADVVSSATPLGILKEGGTQTASYLDLFFGNIGGCIGEVSALLLLIGAAYLLVRKVISLYIPVTYILTVGIFGWVFGGEALFSGDFLFQILSGGVIIGGCFMANDYTTSPVTHKGEIVYAFGAGLITGVIRIFGGYPEGVTYGILIMNIVTPLIDKFMRPRVFGTSGRKAVMEK